MKKIISITAFILIVIIGLYSVYTNTNKSSTEKGKVKKKLYPASYFTHAHGMIVDPNDTKKLYIATHEGLYVLINEKELYQIGNNRDDYMGFSGHPTNSDVFFSSGHPEAGGNIGFQKSKDGAFTWEKVSDGVAGPVDFHAMTVSTVNPNLIFGWYRGVLQRSEDEGKSWKAVGTTPFAIVALAADTKDENIVYAPSPQGAFVSRDKGQNWQGVSEQLNSAFVSLIIPNPKDSQKLLSFSEKLGLAKSNDAGKTWTKINADFEGGTGLYIAFNRQNSNIVYLLTEKNTLYKSEDSGESWNKIL